MRRLNFLLCLLPLTLAAWANAQPQPATRPVRTARPGFPAGTRTALDVNYADSKSHGQTLDLIVPAVAAPDHRVPLVVYVHGGGWVEGDKSFNPLVNLLPLGYAVASINYRLSTEAQFPAQIHDCKAAIRWLRAHADEYHLDAARVGVCGDSAGGHLVALLGTSGDVKELEGGVGKHLDQSSRVQCVVDLYGPSDLSQIWAHGAAAYHNAKTDHSDSVVNKLFGGAVEEKADLVRLANPITFIGPTTPPFLVEHGDRDPIVPLAQSQVLVDALKKANVPVIFEVLPGAGHGGEPFANPTNLALIVGFLQRNLMNPPAR